MTKTANFKIVLGVLLFSVSVCFATQYQYDNLNRLSQTTLDDGTKIVYSYDASGNRSQKVITFQSDLDLNVEVNFKDFAILAAQWLDVPGDPSADIAPWPNVDNFVDYEDLAKLAEQWLAGTGIPGDITGNSYVNFEDLLVLASQWLSVPGIPSADIAPEPNGDGIVNFLDFALLAEYWLVDTQ